MSYTCVDDNYWFWGLFLYMGRVELVWILGYILKSLSVSIPYIYVCFLYWPYKSNHNYVCLKQT